MILLKKFQEAKECLFCGKDKDGYDAECQLGTFSGHVCLADLKKQMFARRNAAPRQEKPIPLIDHIENGNRV